MTAFLTESFATVSRHYKENNLNWPMIIYTLLAHVAAVIGLFSLHKCHPYTLLWTFVLWPITGIGITGGVHRLWCHRSYQATFPLRVYLMLSNSMANQGSIFHWARDHRVHHKYSDVRTHPANSSVTFRRSLLIFSFLRLTLIPTTQAAGSSSRTWAGF